MTVKEIIDGLKFTVDMFLFDPTTGETYKEPRNDMDKTTVDACKGAIELLEQARWIPVSERLPETDGVYLTYIVNPYDSQLSYVMLCDYIGQTWCPVDETASNNVVAWMPLPEPYRENEINTDEN